MRFWLLALAGALAMGALGCDSKTCDTSNCPGCCAGDVCLPGTEKLACGFGGDACAVCTGVTTCTTSQVCGNPTCRPATCASLGRTCGEVSDGCGGVLRCGGCEAGRACRAYAQPGGGETWLCGVDCSPACLGGTACSPEGVCTAPPAGLRFNEDLYRLRAALRLDGAPAIKDASSCSAQSNPDDVLVQLHWKDAEQEVGGTYALRCRDRLDDFPMLMPVPGRYRFTLEPGPAAERALPALPAGGFTYEGEPLEITSRRVGAVAPHFDVNRSALVQGRLRIDGAAPVQNPFCSDPANAAQVVARAELINRSTGVSIPADITCSAPSFGVQRRVVPARYDVRVSPGPAAQQAGLALPSTAVLVRENVGDTLGGAWDVRTVSVSGQITVDGQPPTVGNYCNQPARANDELAWVRFVDPARAYDVTVSVKCDPTFAFTALLPQGGTWKVYVGPGQQAQAAGLNLLPMAVQVIDRLQAPAPLVGLALDQRRARLQGTLTLRGQPPAKGAAFCALAPNTDLAVLRFRDTVRDQEAKFVFRCSSPDWSYAVDLPEGAWLASIERASPLAVDATNLPEGRYLFPFTLSAAGQTTTTADLDADGHDVAFRIRVNGAIPELPLQCTSAPGTVFAQLELTQVSTGAVVTRTLDCSHQTWRITVPMVAGEWKVRLRPDDPEAPLGGLLPGWFSLAAPFTVPTATGTVTLDEVPAALGGAVQVNSAAPVGLTDSSANCRFVGPAAFLRYRARSGQYEGVTRVDCARLDAPPAWSVTFPVIRGDQYDVRLEATTQEPGFSMVPAPVPVLRNYDVP